ncbi:molybdate ABC transporter substrate-binding protein [Arcobacter sp. FWKO B]|uniref:molybdate ABC transporter substrate-binding protein n=1 Tax=Arcobacter sp. FWKO B TaxID=2593672 RepID=UPI0018A5DF9D|nr:molybdate ABC transporter substrate-binding protein [Arcobacter sp. FWKO B]QOG12421.1 molybdate ABC transporter substrate-binding protein [Arcobacter sp. FWKO B]
MKKIILFILLALSLNAQNIQIYGATAMKLALEDLKNEFLKDKKDSDITLFIGSAGRGYAQLTNGMEFDMFFSADRTYAQAIYDDKKGSTKPITYAYGLLTLYSLNEKLLTSDLSSMNEKSVKKIAIANPKLAPYGKAAIEIIEKTSFADIAKSKLVLGDNVAQAAHFVDTGTVEIGMVPYALLKNNTNSKGVYVLLDDSLYTPLEHCFVITKLGENKTLAKEFAEFVISAKGKEIIKSHGYNVP